MYETYFNCVEEVLKTPLETWTFKSNPRYTYMLEHVSKYQGYEYLEYIKKYDLFNKNKDFFKILCLENDSIGNPIRYENFTLCSPTNLRYILHAFLAFDNIKKHNLNDIDIVEIGGGYGGLAFFIIKISDLFKIKINSYTIFDAPVICELQKKYTNKLNINVTCYDISDYQKLNSDYFLISNYCFSEIPSHLRQEYQDKIVPKCSHGFLAWNAIDVYNFTEKPLTIEAEYPLTYNNNSYVTF